jgi:predicted ester cyclase
LATVDENKATIRRLYDEVINAGRLEVIDEIVADDSLDNSPRAGGISGRAGFREHIEWIFAATEGVVTTVTDLIGEGDRVVVFWTMDAIQRGEIFGAPPSGRRFKGASISWATFRDGQISEYSVLPDRLGILRQLTSETQAA